MYTYFLRLHYCHWAWVDRQRLNIYITFFKKYEYFIDEMKLIYYIYYNPIKIKCINSGNVYYIKLFYI